MPAGRGRGNLVPNAARTMTYQSIIASRGILKKRRRGVLFSYNSPVLQALGRHHVGDEPLVGMEGTQVLGVLPVDAGLDVLCVF